MKKVLSVAMASAMVLGMGANAFAIQYSTGTNDTAEWPSNFKFEGQLFVTDKDGNIVKEASTAINTQKSVNFEPGDTIWMPLYADNQKVYGVVGGNTDEQKEVAATTISLSAVYNDRTNTEGKVSIKPDGTVDSFTYTDNVNKVVYYYNQVAPSVKEGWRTAQITSADVMLNGVKATGNTGAIFTTNSVAKDVDAYLPVEITYVAATDSFTLKAGSGYTAHTLASGTPTAFAVSDFATDATLSTTMTGSSAVSLTYEQVYSMIDASNFTAAKATPGGESSAKQ